MTQWCYRLKCRPTALGDTDDTTMYRDTKSSDADIVYASILFSTQKVDVIAEML